MSGYAKNEKTTGTIQMRVSVCKPSVSCKIVSDSKCTSILCRTGRYRGRPLRFHIRFAGSLLQYHREKAKSTVATIESVSTGTVLCELDKIFVHSPMLTARSFAANTAASRLLYFISIGWPWIPFSFACDTNLSFPPSYTDRSPHAGTS